jgi:hypothetical protein
MSRRIFHFLCAADPGSAHFANGLQEHGGRHLEAESAKSKIDPGPGPTSASIVIGEDNKIQYSEELADGKSTNWSVSPTADGTPAPITGMGENSTLVEKRIDARHVEHTWKMGSGTLIGKSVISKSRKTMTYTLSGTNAHGKPVHNVEIFEKQ